jgi:hypothetical protein
MSTLLVIAMAAVAADGATLFFSQFQEASSGNNKYYQVRAPAHAAHACARARGLQRTRSDGLYERALSTIARTF